MWQIKNGHINFETLSLGEGSVTPLVDYALACVYTEKLPTV